MALVFFDLDGTLTKCDTFLPYCLIAFFSRAWSVFVVKPVLEGSIGYLKGAVSRDQLKETFIKVFLGDAERKKIELWNKIFFKYALPLITRRQVLKKAKWHLQNGDRVFIVSASPDIYVSTLARLWKFDGAICTNLEWEDGRVTGRILGSNCRAEEKAKRIQALFNEKELQNSFAYGDSEGDREMFDLVGHWERV